ncbi:MAG: RecQ family ATP-dependent DNA helicase [Chloroflexota bacterium]|nr:RecQ family ATP-dependent DNA helicase [Chloroflexota bacterium]
MTRSQEAEAYWQHSRQIVLDRDEHRCCDCGTREGLHVHHRIPRALGGTDEPANLVTLCAGCHAVRHPNLQVSLARRFLERWTVRLARWLDRAGEIPQDTTALTHALRLLGKERFRDGQLEIVLAALRGESLLAVRPTGSGKSLCFQLPALLTSGVTMVVTPLKALMADQVVALHGASVPATYINGDLSPHEKATRHELLQQGAVKLVYCAPERFDPESVRNPTDVERLLALHPSFFVVDEAHCVDRWGDDFRPSYGKLGDVRERLSHPPVLAFTATAGKEMQTRILQSLGVPEAKVFVADVDRPNIGFIRKFTPDRNERLRITAKLIRQADGKVMIFVPTKRVGEDVKAGLEALGLNVPFYHGKLLPAEREFLLGRYTGRLEPELHAIICTNAFGMGLDIPNVRTVIHWVQSACVEDYVQEVGRAGRDGKPASAVLFTEANDVGLLEYMARKGAPSNRPPDERDGLIAAKIERIGQLHGMARSPRCFRQHILKYMVGEQPAERRSLAMRILGFLLVRRSQPSQALFCCDACNPQEAERYLANGTVRSLHFIVSARLWIDGSS